MTTHGSVPRAAAALLAASGLVLAQIAPVASLQTAPPAKPSTASPPAKSSPAPAPVEDGGWPRDLVTPSGGEIRIFQPQVASWDGQRRMVMYAAVAFNVRGAPEPAMGSVKVEAHSVVAVNERLVNFSTIKLTESNFPGLPSDQLREVVTQIETIVPQGGLVIGLDRVLARLDKSQILPKNVDGVKADPPVIFYSTSPAVLVNVDGDPIWSPIKDNDLKFAVNTNWDQFQHEQSKELFLRYNSSLLTATDVNGPWKPAGKLPDSFSKLPADDNWKEVKAALPARSLSSGDVPKVFV